MAMSPPATKGKQIQKGARKERIDAAPGDEPDSRPLGPPPDRLKDEEKEVWEEAADVLPSLRYGDRMTLGLYCRLVCCSRVNATTAQVMLKLLDKLGGTADSRRRLGGIDPREAQAEEGDEYFG